MKTINAGIFNNLTRVATVLFFIAHFLYFVFLNRYHLSYQEQVQLFRFDWNYLSGFLDKPGGLSEFAGAFFIQFYLMPFAGPAIVTLAGLAVFFLSGSLLRRIGISGILWSFIPVLLIAALQSDYVYNLGYTIGFILALGFAAIYFSIKNDQIRYVSGITGIMIMFHLAGSISFLALLLIILFELLCSPGRRRFLAAGLYMLISLLFLYVVWNYIYLLPPDSEWLNALISVGNVSTKYWLVLLIAYYPLLLIIKRLLAAIPGTISAGNKSKWKSAITGAILLLAIIVGIRRYAYDPKNELLLGIDHHIQNSEWDKALQLSAKSPGVNRIAICLTNIALYKSGHMGDRLFHYNQIGSAGLWLPWGDDAAPFFGCELFYHLGYFNEAYHWAFEALVVKGESPRLLRILAMTSIINGDYAVAGKYLGLLDETIFYRKWAKHYLNCIADTSLLLADKEITERRRQLVEYDFFSDVNHYDKELLNLLKNHPDNKMANEYYISSLLLDKDIYAFAEYIKNPGNSGFDKLPVHYEEALLALGKNLDTLALPDGLRIRELKRREFQDYLNSYSLYSGNPSGELYRRFGKTYWYYLQFR